MDGAIHDGVAADDSAILTITALSRCAVDAHGNGPSTGAIRTYVTDGLIRAAKDSTGRLLFRHSDGPRALQIYQERARRHGATGRRGGRRSRDQILEKIRQGNVGGLLARAKTATPCRSSFNPNTADTLYIEVEASHVQLEHEQSAAKRRVDAAITKLRPQYRAIILRALKGLTTAQIAEELELPKSTTRDNRNAGIATLKNMLHPDDAGVFLREIGHSGHMTEWPAPAGYPEAEDGDVGRIIYGDGVLGVEIRNNPNKLGKDQARRDAKDQADGSKFLRDNPR